MKQLIFLNLLLWITGSVYSDSASPIPQDVIVNLEPLKVSQHLATVWNRHPVWIIKRTEEDIKNIAHIDSSELGAPQGEDWISQFIIAYGSGSLLPNLLELDQLPLEKETYRSYRKDIFVVLGYSPYSGCMLLFKPEKHDSLPQGKWPSGYLDPCQNITFDPTGRVYKENKVERYWNLLIPPHQFTDEKTLVIGLGNPPRKISNTNYEPKIDYEALKPNYRLIEAVKRKKIAIIKDTLLSGVSVEAYVGPGVTPLLTATSIGHNEIVSFLLEKGANINRPNDSGYTPLHAAIAALHLKTIELLAEKGANMNPICLNPDCNGTPLNFAISWAAVQEEEAEKLVQILLKYGADPTISFNGKNAFDWAREKRYYKVLNMLREAKSIR